MLRSRHRGFQSIAAAPAGLQFTAHTAQGGASRAACRLTAKETTAEPQGPWGMGARRPCHPGCCFRCCSFRRRRCNCSSSCRHQPELRVRVVAFRSGLHRTTSTFFFKLKNHQHTLDRGRAVHTCVRDSVRSHLSCHVALLELLIPLHHLPLHHLSATHEERDECTDKDHCG